jgi:amino acid permease
MATDSTLQRSIGLVGATGIGVGAIVGGGILALAGAAFAATGPSAIVAFALNGLIAVITALSFAELSCAFPQSGGTYTFAKKVLSVEAAFAVGWVVWFASIVAAVLYALGFGYFAAIVVQQVWQMLGGSAPAWVTERWAVAGEIREPERNIPRAMLTSLGIALLIYLPLLLVISTAGVAPGESIADAVKDKPEAIIAVAAKQFLGSFGYWLVIVAAILSMLSALQANLFAASRAAGMSPEALTTMAPRPWPEITRVCKTHRCESLLLGLSDLSQDSKSSPLDEFMSSVTCDIVVLRAPVGWQLQQVQRLLVPIGGVAGHDQLRARLLGSLFRTGQREVTFLRVLPEAAGLRFRRLATQRAQS